MRGCRFSQTLLVSAGIGFAVAFSGCGGGSNTMTGTASPTGADVATVIPSATTTGVAPSPTTAAGTDCPVDASVCDFGREVAGLLASGQYDAIAGRTHLYEYTCPGPRPDGAGGPFPLCEGATAGERRSGYSTGALQSEGAVESRDGLISFIRGWVSGGVSSVPGTGPVIATVGCPVVGAAPDCSKRFAIVFTRGDGTSLLRLGVRRDGTGGAAQILQTVTGVIVVNQAMVSGGDDSLPAVFGIEESVGTRYFVID